MLNLFKGVTYYTYKPVSVNERLQLIWTEIYWTKLNSCLNIPDDSILVKVASSAISTNGFFKGDYHTLDAFSAPYWTKDAVTKP